MAVLVKYESLYGLSTIAKGDHLRPCSLRRRQRSLLQSGPAVHSEAALLNTLSMPCLVSSNWLQEGQAAQRAVCDATLIHCQQRAVAGATQAMLARQQEPVLVLRELLEAMGHMQFRVACRPVEPVQSSLTAAVSNGS